ncbi:MAG: glutamate 5-kinase [Cyanobacteria bacterium KgW148]|nr:glutamate 5-kinase [Cyanobacteria bacterium KgW148]
MNLVIKIGTSTLTRPTTGDLHISAIAHLVEVIVELRRQGHSVVLVSSGAVGVGCTRLGITDRPKKLSTRQAVAAVGQSRLMGIYDDFFGQFQQPVAQVLLTRANLVERQHYINVSNTFQELLEMGILPSGDENDTVATEELKFGDNDTLSALVASLVQAQWLFLLTDVDRLYSADPRRFPEAEPILAVSSAELRSLVVDTNTEGKSWGTGGMVTKITAARIATSAGVRTVIMHGREPENIHKILQGEPIGTQFAPNPQCLNARKRWIAYGMIPSGELVLDDGAVTAVTTKGRSLLAAGIVAVRGEFNQGDCVSLLNRSGVEIGRGISFYDRVEVEKIQGCRSEEISDILGYEGETTVVHRDNLVILYENPASVT